MAGDGQSGGDGEGAIAQLSATIRELTAAGDCRRAALACVDLGHLFDNLGNHTAARAWFVRASRLIEHEPPCVEQGWVAVAQLGCEVNDPAVLLARAELALGLARRFGDVNLETKALADAGLAHVQAGRIEDGMALLDEAMALACGPADDAVAAGRSVCSFLTACYYTADFDRAGSWADVLRQQGLVGPRPGVAVFIANHCDAVHATLLCELGRWGEAEALLERAIAQFEEVTGFPSWHPVIALAELRIRQGRLADAEALLLGKEGHVQALLPAARLHLARGDLDLAEATARRGLRAIAGDRLRASELLAVLVDVELARGDLAAAAAACGDLVARAEGLAVPGLEARVAVVRARAQAAGGDVVGAIETIERALDRLPHAGVPLFRASLLLDLVRLHERAGNAAAARVEAGRAAAMLAGLDVVVPPADASLLRRFAGVTGGGRPEARTVTLRRDDRGWAVDCGDMRARVADTKGVRYLAELLRSPGVERHALDLVDCVEGVANRASGVSRHHLGHAGDRLDGQARHAYRHRIEALRAEIDDALASGFEDRAEDLQAELDLLVSELAGAFGLGGRSRRAASAAERARLNVTRALRGAAARLAEVVPHEGLFLDKRLRTGAYCAYEPDEADEVRWVVQS